MKAKTILSILFALLMSFSVFSVGKTVYAADDSFDVSGSKTTEPTELNSDNRETTVTLSLPSAEYKNKIDVVFVMDNSTSTKNSGIDFSINVKNLLDSIVKNNPGVELKVGVVKFRGYATDMLETGLTLYDDSSSETIMNAISNNTVPGSGSNGHSGLVMAEELLSADTDVSDDHKYVVFLTDGKNYIWNNADNEPVTIYRQAAKNGTIQAGGKPRLNQYDGITQKENGAYPSIYNRIPQITDHQTLIFSEGLDINLYDSKYYANLYASDNEELTGESKYDFAAYYTKFYPADSYSGTPTQGDGTVQTFAIANATSDVVPTPAFYKTYYKYTPQEGTFWENVNYLQTNPYEVVLNEEDGKYYYDTTKVNEDFFLWHPSALEKGPYVLGHYWKETIDAKYNTGAIVFYDTGSGTGSHITQSFDQWLVENSDYGAWISDADAVNALFKGIDNSIRYMVSKGVVTDKITDDFTLKNADTKDGFSMTLSGEALGVTFRDGKWYFGEAVDEVYPYEVAYDKTTKTITWTINVPVENANPITLSYDLVIDEDAESNFYDTNVSAVLDYKSTDGTKDGTYTFEKPKVSYIKFIDIPVEKEWSDADDQDGKRPESITVNLMDGTEKVQAAKISEETEWKATFTKVPDSKIVDGKMEKITYKVEEEAVEGYKAEITGSTAEGFKVKNTHEPEKTDITVVKKWEDNENENETRPSAITVNLSADGESVETVRLSENDEWQHTFEGMPKYSKGNEITYTVTEEPVEGYETSVKDFVITNTALYTITYKLNGGEFEGKTEDIIEIYPANTVISIHKAPTRKGYTFLLWEGSEYHPDDEYTVTGDHAFTAQWKKDETPNTGDSSNIALWTSMLAVSAAGIASVILFDRKRRISK